MFVAHVSGLDAKRSSTGGVDEGIQGLSSTIRVILYEINVLLVSSSYEQLVPSKAGAEQVEPAYLQE